MKVQVFIISGNVTASDKTMKKRGEMNENLKSLSQF